MNTTFGVPASAGSSRPARGGTELPTRRQSLWRIAIATTPEAEDPVAELLGSLLEQPASSYFHVKTGLSTVSVFAEQKPAEAVRRKISAGLKRIKNCGLKTGPGRITVAKVRRKDWAESWKRHFKPIEIKVNHRRDEPSESLSSQKKLGTRDHDSRSEHPGWGNKLVAGLGSQTRPSERNKSLLIKPGWSKRKPRKGQIIVVLDPGLGFGTGQHPTTAFCLRELAQGGTSEARRSFFDIGTGSGILAIAAAKLGYSPVRAIDFDPEAVRIARANARANDVHKKLRIVRGDVAKLPIHAAKRYDLVCANLISRLLVAERRRIVAHLKRGGTLVLAGILKPEFPGVQRAFAELGLKLADAQSENEWRSGLFCFARKNFSGEI